ncbi:MAG: NAD-binding protein [Acidimicrobiia bacterium]
MPLIVVGADTTWGEALLEGLSPREREVRVFVSDQARGVELRERGFKVATGDVSDESHVEAAATRCFSAVLIAAAAHDERERSFADSAEAVLRGWANAVANSKVTRVIWVTGDDPPDTAVAEVAVVDPSTADFVHRVIALDDASSLR